MKRIIACALVLTFLFALAGCASNEKPSGTTPPSETKTEPTVPPTTVPQENPVHSALAEFNRETVDGDWCYGYTDNGYSFTLMETFEVKDANGDGVDDEQWFDSHNTGVGIVHGFEGSENWIELNNNGATGAAGIGYKIPEDGTYKFYGTTWNKNGQESSGVIMNCWNNQLEIIPFTQEPTDYSYEVPGLSAGDVVYFWVADEYSWVSAYVTIFAQKQ